MERIVKSNVKMITWPPILPFFALTQNQDY